MFYVQQSDIKEDFRKLRKLVVDKGWLNPKPWFYVLQFAHIVALDVAAVLLLCYFGVSWLTTLVSLLMVTTAQVCTSNDR